jgi:hypothetical protein
MCDLCHLRPVGPEHIHYCSACYPWSLIIGLALNNVTEPRYRSWGSMMCRLSILGGLRRLGYTNYA